jgi:phage terminase small subunit
MKNEKEFKKRISEIAAKIAEADGDPSFDKQVEDLLPTLSNLFNKVRNEEQLADVISAMVKHMPAGKNKSVVTAGLKIAGKVANTDPAVSKDDPKAMYDKMPVPDGLKEAYERIKRK